MSQRAEGGVWPAELKLLQHLSGCPRTDKSVLFEEAQALWETLSDDSGLPQCTHKGFKNHSPVKTVFFLNLCLTDSVNGNGTDVL